jgi:hypothetical protein
MEARSSGGSEVERPLVNNSQNTSGGLYRSVMAAQKDSHRHHQIWTLSATAYPFTQASASKDSFSYVATRNTSYQQTTR